MKPDFDEARLRVAALRMARQLVSIIGGVLYEWEVRDAENEFFETILAELKELDGAEAGDGRQRKDAAGQ